ncbi:hypothetical protein HDU89_001677 [Geranomyces variabilis]|nr:hypothetical protein HDU89_001677 [Geranomyces variabilis]
MAPHKTYASLATIALLAPLSSAHMMIHPKAGGVWGGDSSNLENPLTADTKNWFCHGKKKSDATRGRTTFTAGQTTTIPIICGEAVDDYQNAKSICTDSTAWHGGGGCALSILYKNDASVSDLDKFVTFSVAADCPNKANPVPFKVPANLPNIADAVCAWHWIPNPKNANSEMYMNCFSCEVVGGPTGQVTGGTRMSDHLWAVRGQKNGDSKSRQLKNQLPDGAQKIEVNGKAPRAPQPPKKTKTAAPAPTDTSAPEDDTTSYEPEEPTAEPTSVPEETTACAPSESTAAPEETSSGEPEPTLATSSPEETTTYAPEPTATPEETTPAPDETASPEPTDAPSYPEGRKRRARRAAF